MPKFNTYVDVYVDDFLYECSTREIEELIDSLVKDGWVKRITPKGVVPTEQQPSLLDLEWQSMVSKLSELRQNISLDDESLIKEIISKY